MNTNPSPKSIDQNVQALGTVCHVVEVRDHLALVHASPTALAQIIGQLGLTVGPSKRGGDYYAVRVGQPVERTSAPAAKAAPAPRAAAPTPLRSDADLNGAIVGTDGPNGMVRMVIGGAPYNVVETPCKRSVDVRRWEVSKPGQDGEKPYVVTFQAADGSRTACSCKGGIFHKHCKHMDALRAAYGKRNVANVA